MYSVTWSVLAYELIETGGERRWEVKEGRKGKGGGRKGTRERAEAGEGGGGGGGGGGEWEVK